MPTDRYFVALTGTPEQAQRLANVTGVEAFRQAVQFDAAAERMAGFMSTTGPYQHLHPENLIGHARRCLEAAFSPTETSEP